MNARWCIRETRGGGEKFEPLTGTTAWVCRMTLRAGLNDGVNHAELVHNLVVLPLKERPPKSASPAVGVECAPELRNKWPNAFVVVASACRGRSCAKEVEADLKAC